MAEELAKACIIAVEENPYFVVYIVDGSDCKGLFAQMQKMYLIIILVSFLPSNSTICCWLA